MPKVVLETSEAIYRLRQCKSILAPDDAIEYLKQKFLSYRLLALYQQFFPAEYANSLSSFYPNELEFENWHSPKEIEFLHLVNAHLFPLPEYQLESADSEKFYQIPLISMGVDWLGEDFDELKPEWQILLPLSAEGRYFIESADATEWYEYQFGVPLKTITHPNKIDIKLLIEMCDRATKPLNLLPLALQLLDYESNNVWLDICEAWETENLLPWTSENVKYLQSQWQEAEVILEQVYSLINWLELKLIPHFELILSVWNTSSLVK